MKKIHLIVPDLLLPKQFAAEVSAEIAIPVLQKILSRATATQIPARSVEAALCAAFGVDTQQELPIAPISAAFDGLDPGCWLRADPVCLRLQRDHMLLSQVTVSPAEAAQLCASLTEYFAGQGMTFFAPHPERWYVRTGRPAKIRTTPLSEVIGANVRGALPRGADALRWHQVFNESQMLLYAHPVNEARQERGELPINSLWFWGGGDTRQSGIVCEKNYDSANSDESLTEMFARAAGVPYQESADVRQENKGSQLLLHSALRSAIQSGDLHRWRAAVQAFEQNYAQPLWQAMRAGKLARLQIDVLAGENSKSFVLTRRDSYQFWRRGQRLAAYSLV